MPALSHSPYGFSLSTALPRIGQSLWVWPIRPQLKHQPTNLSYLKATRTTSPSGLITGPPRLSHLFSGTSTRIRKNRDWSEFIALQSTYTSSPMLRPISLPASSFIRSKDSPHTWIQNGCFVNVTFLTDIPFSHRRSAKRWSSKHHGPLWLSIENLNCNNPSPTSIIFKSWSPSFHMDRSKFVVSS